jgi:peptidoglycan/LPS O-acetylase OafA/YrhL
LRPKRRSACKIFRDFHRQLELSIDKLQQRGLLPFPASPAEPQAKGVFLSLTAMRGVAALLVAFFHLRFGIIGVPLFDYYVFSFRFGNKGYLWVDFFFILSGFILTYRYRDVCHRLNLRLHANFIWHRFARIWPLQFVTVVSAVLYLGYKHGIAYVSPSAVIANLLLVHGWGHYFPPPLNFPSWSLSDEWGAYLVLPLYLFVIARIRSRIVHVLLIVVLFAGLAWYATVFGHGTLDLLRERGGLERCLFQVGIGVSLFQLYDFLKRQNAARGRKMASRLPKLFDAAAALIFIAIFFVFTYTNNDLYFVPLAGALIFCLSLSHGFFSNFLSLRPMVLLGEISFSIYMLHAFVLWLFQDIPLSYKAHLGWWTGAFFLLAEHLLVLVLAYLSYKGIERPAHRFLVRR